MIGIEAAGTPYDDKSGVLRPPAEAIALSAIRGLPSGAMRQYTAVEYPRGWAGVEHDVRTFWALGLLAPTEVDGYAVLDVLNAEGEEVADYTVRTSEGFAYIKKRLCLTVVDTDAIVRSLNTGSNPSAGGSDA